MKSGIFQVGCVAGILLLLSGCSTKPASTVSDSSADSPLDQCWQKVDARSQLAGCLQQMLSNAGAKANQEETQTQAQAHQLDITTAANINAEKHFESAKRSFHQFRERYCRWQEAMIAGGSGAGDNYRACYVETTRWWNQLLKKQLQDN